jgi:hypothetical protein
MGDDVKDPNLIPGWYAVLFHKLAPVARELGYALAIHGTLARDLDLIAVPWTEQAVPEGELVEAIRAHVGGTINNDPQAQAGDETRTNPVLRAHGRYCWAIQIGGGMYLDLSVTPTHQADIQRLMPGKAYLPREDLQALHDHVAALEAALRDVHGAKITCGCGASCVVGLGEKTLELLEA